MQCNVAEQSVSDCLILGKAEGVVQHTDVPRLRRQDRVMHGLVFSIRSPLPNVTR